MSRFSHGGRPPLSRFPHGSSLPTLITLSPTPSSFVELILIAVARLVAGRTAVVRLVRSHANIHGVAGLTAVVRRVLSYVSRSVA